MVALRSPHVMIPTSLDRSCNRITDTSTTPVTIHTLSHEDGPRDPTFQMYSCSTFSGRPPEVRWGDAPFQNLASMSLLTASTTSADEYAPEVAFMTWPMILLAAFSFF